MDDLCVPIFYKDLLKNSGSIYVREGECVCDCVCVFR